MKIVFAYLTFILCIVLFPKDAGAAFLVKKELYSTVNPETSLNTVSDRTEIHLHEHRPPEFTRVRQLIHEAIGSTKEKSHAETKHGYLGLTSLCLGVAGIISVAAFIGLTSVVGAAAIVFFVSWPICSIAAIVFGATALKRKESRKGRAIAGLTAGILGTLVFALLFVGAVIMIASFK
jgi:hypothetical protein